MNEVNAISTSEGDKTPPATGCPDAKREGSQAMDLSAAPLPGRRCPIDSMPCPWTPCRLCRVCEWVIAKKQGTGERSGPGNKNYPEQISA